MRLCTRQTRASALPFVSLNVKFVVGLTSGLIPIKDGPEQDIMMVSFF